MPEQKIKDAKRITIFCRELKGAENSSQKFRFSENGLKL